MVGGIVSILKRGDFWYANWQEDGTQKRKSLETKNKKEARLRAARLETQILAGELKPNSRNATIREVADAYFEFIEIKRLKPKTVSKYRCTINRVCDLAATKKIKSISDLNVRFIDAYRHVRVQAGRADKSIYNEVMVIRQLVNFARNRGFLTDDPLAGLRLTEPKPTEQPCWSPEEREKILEAATEPKRSILTALADTGARVGEIRWLTWEDVDLKKNVLHIRAKDDWTPKTGDRRAIPLSARLRSLLSNRKRRHRWVFTSPPSRKYPKGDHQISDRRLLRYLKRILNRLGLEGHLHTFRHTFISELISKGVPEAVVRNIVGHVDDRVIRLYTHIADQRAQDAIKTLNSSPDGPVAPNDPAVDQPTEGDGSDDDAKFDDGN
jgi:site-specific recombinase XerD